MACALMREGEKGIAGLAMVGEMVRGLWACPCIRDSKRVGALFA